jgi:hypothetical protein
MYLMKCAAALTLFFVSESLVHAFLLEVECMDDEHSGGVCRVLIIIGNNNACVKMCSCVVKIHTTVHIYIFFF